MFYNETYYEFAGNDELKRIIVWVDSKDEDAEQVCKRLEKLLSSMGRGYKIVDVCELKWTEDDK